MTNLKKLHVVSHFRILFYKICLNYEGRQMGKNFSNGICGDMLEYKKPKQKT